MKAVQEERDSKAMYAKMANVVAFNISGMKMSDIRSRGAPLLNMEKVVEERVKAIMDGLKSSGEKFSDTDFGPSDADEFGAVSLYGPKAPDPAGHSKYPSPESLSWLRPQYFDDTFDEGGGSDENGDGNGDGGDDDEMNELCADASSRWLTCARPSMSASFHFSSCSLL
jgi:hypothetical protein